MKEQRLHRRVRRTAAIFAATSALVLGSGNARAQITTSTSIRLEAVSDYRTVSGGSTVNDTDAVTEADGFWNNMVGQSGWTAGSYWKDNWVWDTDFYDPELTGTAGDNDSYTDAAGTGISWYVMHGLCTGAFGDLEVGGVTACTSDANCGAGRYCPGGHIVTGSQHMCISQKARYFWTSSTTSGHSNLAAYGQTYGQTAVRSIAWGEDGASGTFGGAGNNGGTNVAIITNSCGFRSRYLDSETPFMFAGLHAVLVSVPTNAVGYTGTFGAFGYSDTVQWAERGLNLAGVIKANMNAPMGDTWFNPLFVTYHGYTAKNGAPAEGANAIIAKGPTTGNVQFHAINETWTQSRLEGNDVTGAGHWWWRVSCNYDCNTLGL